MVLDLATGAPLMLMEDARIGDLAFNAADKSLWGLRHDNGYVTLVRIPAPYQEYSQVHTFAYGVVPFELDISPDGEFLSSSIGEVDGTQFLRVFRTRDLLQKKLEPVRQFDFGQAIPEGFVFSPDGRYLFGSAYYTGISNIYRYELKTGDLEAVSNAETGLFRPIPQADGSLIVLEHTGQGFLPATIDPLVLKDLSAITLLGAEIARQRPVVMTWGAGSPDSINLEAATTSTRDYVAGQEMRLETAYPIVEGYKNSAALGWYLRFADPLGLETLGITASYSPASGLAPGERLHLDLDYKTLNWHGRISHNAASFYDLFGPTKRSLRGNAYQLGYHRPLIMDDPRRLDFQADLAWYTGLETAPGNQNVQSAAGSVRSAKAGLNYSNTYRSANAVDHESGQRWTLMATAVDANGNVPGLRGGLDFGVPLAWPHASIWLYSAAGARNGERANSYANFYFGGFQNNYVDNGEVKRYREFDTFPGFEIDQLSGQSFAKSVLELKLPPLRFEAVGTPGLYLSWIRPAIFGGWLATDPGKSGQQRIARNLGAQLDLSIQALHRLPMTLSVGYARGFQNGLPSSREWMVSLKILGQ